MLKTPLGEIIIQIDDQIISYNTIKLPLDHTCQNLDGRYCIRIPFIPNGKNHEICCYIKDYIPHDDDGLETGERLELKSFYANKCKLSIGAEGDAGYIDGVRYSDFNYDYDNVYTDNGVKYIIFPNTITNEYVFGIAWINNVNDENDFQTWFGADPTLI